MKGGYESLIWIQDEKGKEYVCNAEHIHRKTRFGELTDKERRDCFDVNYLVGTERW